MKHSHMWGSLRGLRELWSAVTHTFLRGHSRRAQHSSSKMGVRISTKWAESGREERRRPFRLSADTVTSTAVELTVGSGPDGDAGSLSRPLPGEGAHRQHVLPVRLQTVYGHGLSSGVWHGHVEQIWWTDELYSNTTPVFELPTKTLQYSAFVKKPEQKSVGSFAFAPPASVSCCPSCTVTK